MKSKAELEAERAKGEAKIAAEQAEREAMPGVFRDVIVTSNRTSAQAKIELFFSFSKSKKVKRGVPERPSRPIVRVHAIKSGDRTIFTPGTTFLCATDSNMPQVLQQAILKADIRINEVMKEVDEKRAALQEQEAPAKAA